MPSVEESPRRTSFPRNVLWEMERGLRQERQFDDEPTDPTAVRREQHREPERDERDGEQGEQGDRDLT